MTVGHDDFLNHERTSLGKTEESETEDFRQYTYATDDERVEPFRGLSATAYAERRLESPYLRSVLEGWNAQRTAPYEGVSVAGTSGAVREDPSDVLPGEGAPTRAMVRAARALIDAVGSDVLLPLRSRSWRAWSNPEWVIFQSGVRLEELSAENRSLARGLVRATLGARGSQLVFDLMELNDQLGSLLDLNTVMNRDSYQLAIFGEPSMQEPWGWQLFGHHVSVNVVVHGKILTLGPVFLGAEPDVLQHDGSETRVFRGRERTALRFAQSLDESQLARLRTYESVRDENMPEYRLHPLDERMLAGAFQDNAVVPQEGINASEFSERQWNLLLTLIEQSLEPSPRGPLLRRLRLARKYRADTWVTWIGAIDGDLAPFYFRIQSPVLLLEFDHHAGVWLNNQFPARFHVHSISRVPGGGDYGGLLRDGEE